MKSELQQAEGRKRGKGEQAEEGGKAQGRVEGKGGGRVCRANELLSLLVVGVIFFDSLSLPLLFFMFCAQIMSFCKLLHLRPEHTLPYTHSLTRSHTHSRTHMHSYPSPSPLSWHIF